MVQQFLRNRALYDEVAKTLWSKDEFIRANLSDLGRHDLELKGMWAEPSDASRYLSSKTWLLLKQSGVVGVEHWKQLGGIAFVTHASGLAISGSSRGYLVTFAPPSTWK